MKKIIVVVLAVCLFMGCTLSCSVVKKSDYRYADSDRFSVVQPSETFWSEIYEHSEDAGLESVLALLSTGLKKFYSDLNFDWDSLDSVQGIQMFVLGEEEIQELSIDTLVTLNSHYALYDNESIYLFPSFAALDTNMQMYLLVHELMHAALASKTKTHVEEGLADFYAFLYMDGVGIEVSNYCYPNEMIVAMWLFAIFGEKETIQAVRDGNLLSMIDEKTKPNMGERLENALIFLHQETNATGQDKALALNTVYDILTHAAIKAGKNEDASLLLAAAKSACDVIGIELDVDYFNELLQRKNMSLSVNPSAFGRGILV